MSAAAGDTLSDQLATSLKKHKLELIRFSAQDVAIGSLECGACYYQTGAGILCLAQSRGEGAKPHLPILVGQRDSRLHASHIFSGMVLIALDEIDTERAGERRADHALAGSGDTHHNVKTFVHQLLFEGNWRVGISESSKNRLRSRSSGVTVGQYLTERVQAIGPIILEA